MFGAWNKALHQYSAALLQCSAISRLDLFASGQLNENAASVIAIAGLDDDW